VDPNTDIHDQGHSDWHAHADTNTNADSDRVTDRDANTNADSSVHSDEQPNVYLHVYTNSYPHAHRDTPR
jgi:hypothetical protein